MKESYDQIDLGELMNLVENYETQFQGNNYNLDYEAYAKRTKAPWYTFKYLKKVSTLTEGASFGELALIMDKPRVASIIATKSCDFATLNREQFNEILKKVHEEQINK